MKQLYDPKLREAAEEIKEILKKYDAVATVLLVSPTHAEFVNHVEASWSVMKYETLEDGRKVIRFRSKCADFSSKEAQHEATEASLHAVTSIIEWSRQLHETFRGLVVLMSKHMKIGWKTWGVEPDSWPGKDK